jgi:hypothetical protein
MQIYRAHAAHALGLRRIPIAGIRMGVCSSDQFRPWPPLLLRAQSLDKRFETRFRYPGRPGTAICKRRISFWREHLSLWLQHGQAESKVCHGEEGQGGLFFPAAVVDVQERPIPNPFASMAFLNSSGIVLECYLGRNKRFLDVLGSRVHRLQRQAYRFPQSVLAHP